MLICKFILQTCRDNHLTGYVSWVFSSLQPSSDLQGHNYYDPSHSSTYQALSGYTWSISYADGSGASGQVGTDTVTIGGTTVQTQAVELASTASSSFLQGSNDGLVGLAFSSINTGMQLLLCRSECRTANLLTQFLSAYQYSLSRNPHSLITPSRLSALHVSLPISPIKPVVPTTLARWTTASIRVLSSMPQ